MASRSGGRGWVERKREREREPNVAALRSALYRDAIVILEFVIYYGNTSVRGLLRV